MQHIHRVKTTPALERPAPLLIRLDQRHENIELIAFRRAKGSAPKPLDLCKCGAVVFVGTDRADLHGGPRQNFATVKPVSKEKFSPLKLSSYCDDIAVDE